MNKCEIKVMDRQCKKSLVSGLTIEVEGNSVHCCRLHFNMYNEKVNVPVFTSTPIIKEEVMEEKCIGCEAPQECCKDTSEVRTREFPVFCVKSKHYHRNVEDLRKCVGAAPRPNGKTYEAGGGYKKFNTREEAVAFAKTCQGNIKPGLWGRFIVSYKTAPVS